MKPTHTTLSLLLGTFATAEAATLTITALDVRANGVFGHDPNISSVTVNGLAPAGTVIADPVDVQMTYSNLDLDGDATPDDSVTFTVRYSGGGVNQRIFNQGVDTGFGNLNEVTVSVLGVSGTTTSLGNNIVFDGFTGGNAGAGGSGAVDRSVEINGANVTLTTPGAGGFEFTVQGVDFAPTPSVTFDNSGGTFGSIVARSLDLQFSTIPEPSSVALIGLAGGLLLRRRRS